MIDFIREEQKFESFEALKLQLEVDKTFALQYFENWNS